MSVLVLPRSRVPGRAFLIGMALLGVVLVVTASVVAGSLLADIGYVVLDPRVRYVRA